MASELGASTECGGVTFIHNDDVWRPCQQHCDRAIRLPAYFPEHFVAYDTQPAVIGPCMQLAESLGVRHLGRDGARCAHAAAFGKPFFCLLRPRADYKRRADNQGIFAYASESKGVKGDERGERLAQTHLICQDAAEAVGIGQVTPHEPDAIHLVGLQLPR